MATARATLPLVALLVSILYISGRVESGSATPSAVATNFIKSSCSATSYPTLCVESLSVYANAIQTSPRQLAQTALAVSLARAQSTKTFVSRLTKFKGLKKREIQAIQDCLEEIDDTTDRISKSINEFKHCGGSKDPDFSWHMSNVETWISAAITDENTCVDGFAGRALNGKIKDSIKARLVNVAHVTSNALALINKFAGQ